ncbi:hypothetical protein ACVW1C_007440 [Bradyrhizobium sp. USDA 4011]
MADIVDTLRSAPMCGNRWVSSDTMPKIDPSIVATV